MLILIFRPVYSRPRVTDNSTTAPAWVSFARASRPGSGQAGAATLDPTRHHPGSHNTIRPRLVCPGPHFSRLTGPGTARPTKLFSGATRPRIITFGPGRPRADRPLAYPGGPVIIPPAAAQTMTPIQGVPGHQLHHCCYCWVIKLHPGIEHRRRFLHLQTHRTLQVEILPLQAHQVIL